MAVPGRVEANVIEVEPVFIRLVGEGKAFAGLPPFEQHCGTWWTPSQPCSNGSGFRSLQSNIDITTATGRLILHVFCSLAEFERDLIRERTQVGLTAARARGRLGGRKPVMTPEKAAAARQMYDAQQLTVSEIARVVGVSRATLYRHLGVQDTGGRRRQTT